MEFKIGNDGCIKIVTAFENSCFCGVSEELKEFLQRKKLFTGKQGQIYTSIGPNSEKVILVGLGKEKDISYENIRRSFLNLGKELKKNTVCSCNLEIKKIEGLCYKLTAQAMMEGIINSTYVFDKFLKEKAEDYSCDVFLTVLDDKREKIEDAIKEIKTLMEAVFMCRDLVNRPSNDIYPETLANFAKEELVKVGVEVEILEKNKLNLLKWKHSFQLPEEVICLQNL